MPLYFENRVLRKIFVPKREEVRGEWRKIYNFELNDLYSEINIFRVIKYKIMRSGYVASVGEKRGLYRILVGNP